MQLSVFGNQKNLVEVSFGYCLVSNLMHVCGWNSKKQIENFVYMSYIDIFYWIRFLFDMVLECWNNSRVSICVPILGGVCVCVWESKGGFKYCDTTVINSQYGNRESVIMICFQLTACVFHFVVVVVVRCCSCMGFDLLSLLHDRERWDIAIERERDRKKWKI